MKKLLAIIVLGLLFSGNAYAEEIIKLNQGIVVKIPKGYEHIQFNHKRYQRTDFDMNNISQDIRREQIKGQEEIWGYDGSETITLIGKKGFADLYGDAMKHMMSGRDFSTWSRFSELSKKCGNKITPKSQVKCINNFLKIEPMIQIIIGNNTTDYIKEINIEIDQLKTKDKKEINETNKSESGQIKLSENYKINLEAKYANIQNKKWGIDVSTDASIEGSDVNYEMKAKSAGYIFIHNKRQFSIQGFCQSRKNCKKIKKLNNQIIEPYLSRYTQN